MAEGKRQLMTPHELQRTAELDRQWTEVTDWLREQEPVERRAWIDCCIAGAPLNPVQIESLKKLASRVAKKTRQRSARRRH
jgi:hypothetical protein